MASAGRRRKHARTHEIRSWHHFLPCSTIRGLVQDRIAKKLLGRCPRHPNRRYGLYQRVRPVKRRGLSIRPSSHRNMADGARMFVSVHSPGARAASEGKPSIRPCRTHRENRFRLFRLFQVNRICATSCPFQGAIVVMSRTRTEPIIPSDREVALAAAATRAFQQHRSGAFAIASRSPKPATRWKPSICRRRLPTCLPRC